MVQDKEWHPNNKSETTSKQTKKTFSKKDHENICQRICNLDKRVKDNRPNLEAKQNIKRRE